MKENKTPLHAYNTAGDTRFQEESIRQQIAQQDAIIQNAQRIIEKATSEIDKAKSDQLIANNARDYFLQQMEPNSRTKINIPVAGSLDKDSSKIAVLKVLAATSTEKGEGILGIHKKLPDISRGTVFRTVKILVEEGKVQQVNSKSKKNRRFRVAS